MKNPKALLVLLALSSGFIRPAGASIGESGAVGPVQAADSSMTRATTVGDGSKNYTLYMGADIVVRIDGVLCPVRGVRGSNWIVDFKGEQRFVPTRQAATQIKVVPNLKLAQRSAAIEDFKADRGFSFDNDPGVRLTRGLDRVASMNADMISIARDAQARADTVGNKALGVAGTLAGTDDQFSQAAIQQTMNRLSTPVVSLLPGVVQFTAADAKALASAYSSAVTSSQDSAAQFYENNAVAAANQTENGNEPGSRLPTSGVDAINVEFEISSAAPVRSPYVVTVAQFHAKNSKPGMVQNLVYAREIHEIGVQPTRVAFVESGYPPDFQLLNFQLHVFSNGQEIPTSISQRRVELNWQDAFEYLKLDYVGSHKNATLSAVPVMATLPPDLSKRLEMGQVRDSFYVRVSEEGLGEAGFSDSSCKNRIEDPYLQTVVQSLRFTPALLEGKPVEGVASINLRQLKI